MIIQEICMRCAILLLFSISFCYGQVIFSDDFEDDPSDWECADGYLSKWSSTSCGEDATFGSEWKMGNGRSGNGVFSWKKSGIPTGFRSAETKWLTGDDVKTEIYHRWYMIIPPDDKYDKSCSAGVKFWRYYVRENGYEPSGKTVFLNVTGGRFSTGTLAILDVFGSNHNLDLCNISAINDSTWRCFELRMKLNTVGNSDGLIEFWLDGELTASRYDINWGFDTHDRRHQDRRQS